MISCLQLSHLLLQAYTMLRSNISRFLNQPLSCMARIECCFEKCMSVFAFLEIGVNLTCRFLIAEDSFATIGPVNCT